MDIEEYLSKKKELEKKKELLEAKEHLRSEKDRHVKRYKPDDHRPSRHRRAHDDDGDERPHRGRSNENSHWFLLSVAFLVAIVIVGVFSIYYFFPQEKGPSEIELLEEQIKELQQNLEEQDTTEKETEEDTEKGTEDEDTEEDTEGGKGVSEVGPDFTVFLEDDWKDEDSIGVFDKKGKIGGEIIQVFGSDYLYKYRLVIENEETSKILCKVDEETLIDEDYDGEVDEEKHKLDLHILEIDKKDRENLKDSVLFLGKITGTYDVRCYFCVDSACNNYYEAGETKKSAKFRVNVYSNEDNNETES